MVADILTLTEVQVKAFGPCTTFRSLIMEKQTSADTLSSMAAGSVQCHIAQLRQTADILKPGYTLSDCNLPQISRASCQMLVFPSLPPCCRSGSDRLYNSAPPLQSLNHGYRAILQSESPISGSHQAHISSLASDQKGKSPSDFPTSDSFFSGTLASTVFLCFA